MHQMTVTRRQTLALGLGATLGWNLLGAGPAGANTVPFDTAWDHLTFRRLTPNRFELRQTRLTVIADASSSILYRILPADMRAARRAAWSWQVEASVPPSDLSQIGNDDRNLGMFFVSAPADQADGIREGSSIARLLRNRAVKVLMYTWGGNLPLGSVVPSPHAPDRLRNLITRPAQTGQFSESVDLAADFQRVFNTPLEVLVAVAVSSKSENTPARVLAHVSDLRVT